MREPKFNVLVHLEEGKWRVTCKSSDFSTIGGREVLSDAVDEFLVDLDHVINLAEFKPNSLQDIFSCEVRDVNSKIIRKKE